MDARGRAVLVTGSRGFVGRWLTEVCDVVHLEDADGAIDIRMTERVSSLIRSARPRAVIHLAAQSFVPRSFADPRETYDINFYGTLSILTALQEATHQRKPVSEATQSLCGQQGLRRSALLSEESDWALRADSRPTFQSHRSGAERGFRSFELCQAGGGDQARLARADNPGW